MVVSMMESKVREYDFLVHLISLFFVVAICRSLRNYENPGTVKSYIVKILEAVVTFSHFALIFNFIAPSSQFRSFSLLQTRPYSYKSKLASTFFALLLGLSHPFVHQNVFDSSFIAPYPEFILQYVLPIVNIASFFIVSSHFHYPLHRHSSPNTFYFVITHIWLHKLLLIVSISANICIFGTIGVHISAMQCFLLVYLLPSELSKQQLLNHHSPVLQESNFHSKVEAVRLLALLVGFTLLLMELTPLLWNVYSSCQIVTDTNFSSLIVVHFLRRLWSFLHLQDFKSIVFFLNKNSAVVQYVVVPMETICRVCYVPMILLMHIIFPVIIAVVRMSSFITSIQINDAHSFCEKSDEIFSANVQSSEPTAMMSSYGYLSIGEKFATTEFSSTYWQILRKLSRLDNIPDFSLLGPTEICIICIITSVGTILFCTCTVLVLKYGILKLVKKTRIKSPKLHILIPLFLAMIAWSFALQYNIIYLEEIASQNGTAALPSFPSVVAPSGVVIRAVNKSLSAWLLVISACCFGKKYATMIVVTRELIYYVYCSLSHIGPLLSDLHQQYLPSQKSANNDCATIVAAHQNILSPNNPINDSENVLNMGFLGSRRMYLRAGKPSGSLVIMQLAIAALVGYNLVFSFFDFLVSRNPTC